MATHFFILDLQYVIWVFIEEYLGIICTIENYYAGVENMGGRGRNPLPFHILALFVLFEK